MKDARTLFAVGAIGMVTLLAGSGAQAAENWPLTKPYVVAGSTGATLSMGPVAVNEAGGVLDCNGGVGGACFDTTGHDGAFTVTATDQVSGSVGIFAGFDVDGDGCVACKNGMAGMEDGDVFFQGADSVTGFVPSGLADPTLYVFVRVATANTGDLGTTGALSIESGFGPFDPNDPDCREGRCCGGDLGDEKCFDNDPDMGTVCVGEGEERRCERMMYPYQGTP